MWSPDNLGGVPLCGWEEDTQSVYNFAHFPILTDTTEKVSSAHLISLSPAARYDEPRHAPHAVVAL